MSRRAPRWPRLVGTSLMVGGVMVASVVLTSTTAGAKAAPAKGTIVCSTVTGTIKFKPGLTNTTRTVKMSVALKLANSGCIASGDTASPAKEWSTINTNNLNLSKSNVNLELPLDCGGLNRGHNAPSTWTTKWSVPKGTAPSIVSFDGFSAGASSDAVTLSFPGGGTAGVTGSYTGTDGGANSTVSLVSEGTDPLSACTSKKGLTSLTISLGTVDVG